MTLRSPINRASRSGVTMSALCCVRQKDDLVGLGGKGGDLVLDMAWHGGVPVDEHIVARLQLFIERFNVFRGRQRQRGIARRS